jgi:hypothetical protein
MTSPSRDKILRMDGWPGGMNNRMRETEQSTQRGGESIESSAFLRRALNVDLTKEGHPLRRKGYALESAGYAHSAWYSKVLQRYFVVQAGQVLSGPRVSELAPFANVNRYLRMSYAEHAGEVFYSNGADTGRYGVNGYKVWPDPAMVPADPVAPEYDEDVSVEYVGQTLSIFIALCRPDNSLPATRGGSGWRGITQSTFPTLCRWTTTAPPPS